MKNREKRHIQTIFQMGKGKNGTCENFGGTQKLDKKTTIFDKNGTSEKFGVTEGSRKKMKIWKDETCEEFASTQKFRKIRISGKKQDI